MIELRDEEAQCVVDVINVVRRDLFSISDGAGLRFRKVLHETNILTVDERKRVLSLLCKLAKSAYVLPRCYELKGVQYDPKSFVPGGFADVYRGEYEKQQICTKMVRLSCNDPPQRLTVSNIFFSTVAVIPFIPYSPLSERTIGTRQRARSLGSPLASEYTAVLWGICRRAITKALPHFSVDGERESL